MAQNIDGKLIAQKIHEETAAETNRIKEKYGLQPGLVVVLIGEDPASQVYVNMKEKKSKELGFYSDKIVLDKNATMDEVLTLIDKLNKDPKVHGILVQSPPPPQIDEDKVIESIDPKKDVDCFHAENVGKMLIGKTDGFYPCTPYGVMKLLEYSDVDPCGKHAVIIGRSNIVGKPMMSLLMQKAKGANATVTVCHSRTPNIPEIASQADILVAAIGKPEFVTADMVKDGAVVIDVGINRVDDASKKRGYRLVGDVAYAEVAEKASLITPVPGGVGPMTIAMLMNNALKACKMQNNVE
ncbi:MAG TPA: bifunctional 5,10-methylenetetrahydrofolate dehydrogenase/5,10-methenyltetrahydrofolate cyclohydrolase [Victivallales bacterium]|nr:bifunctional 5,10-methylenetetrahydrofolate dehydrogenase/5,10-methenyltetrahydrofolate cyclohydrolase [Victivallales bacterium]